MMGNAARIARPRSRGEKVTLAPGFSQLHWMRLTQSNRDLSGLGGAPKRRKISREEVAQHHTEEDCWSILDGRVYNMTPYLQFHPGGVATLMMAAGGDCTALFNESHAWVNGHGMLEKCYIGEIDESSPAAAPKDAADEDISPFALSKTEWRAFELLKIQLVSDSTKLFTFALPPDKTLGLEIPGQHLKVRVLVRGRMIERALTPVSAFDQHETFDLLVKLYPDGAMSQALAALPVGSQVDMLGPFGRIGYPEPCIITLDDRVVQDRAEQLVMVAAGSGITPMLQLLRAVVERRATDAMTRITLVYCNRSFRQIIAREELLAVQQQLGSHRCYVHHVLSDAEPFIDGQEPSLLGPGPGRVITAQRLDAAILKSLLPQVDLGKVAALHCGPPSFDADVKSMLQSVGLSAQQIFQF